MALRIPVYLNAIVFLALIPCLEIGVTHVFNPDWPAHARLHEVWQLTTNGLLSILAALLVRIARYAIIGAVVALTINTGFLLAFVGASTYGGGMAHSDGSELLVAGVNPAPVIVGALFIAISAGALRSWHSDHAPR